MSEAITVVDYGVSNVRSMVNMIKKVGCEAVVATDPAHIHAARRIILPGVGSFDNGIIALQQRGLFDAIKEKMERAPVPLLGVCLGMQLLGEGSDEGELEGFGFVKGTSRRFQFDQGSPYRIPHMGWNELIFLRESKLFGGPGQTSRFYFAHSYHMTFAEELNELKVAVTDHGGEVTAAFEKDLVAGSQFHPEKSHRFGMELLKNFGVWHA